MKEIDDLKRDKPKYPNREISFNIPITPSVNHMYIPTKSGKKILNATAKKYIRDVQNIVRNEMKASKWQTDNDNVWYHMDLYFYFQDKRIRDSHNCIKLLTDTLEGLLFKNDYFVMPRIQHVELDKKNPRIEVIFKPEVMKCQKVTKM